MLEEEDEIEEDELYEAKEEDELYEAKEVNELIDLNEEDDLTNEDPDYESEKFYT